MLSESAFYWHCCDIKLITHPRRCYNDRSRNRKIEMIIRNVLTELTSKSCCDGHQTQNEVQFGFQSNAEGSPQSGNMLRRTIWQSVVKALCTEHMLRRTIWQSVVKALCTEHMLRRTIWQSVVKALCTKHMLASALTGCSRTEVSWSSCCPHLPPSHLVTDDNTEN